MKTLLLKLFNLHLFLDQKQTLICYILFVRSNPTSVYPKNIWSFCTFRNLSLQTHQIKHLHSDEFPNVALKWKQFDLNVEWTFLQLLFFLLPLFHTSSSCFLLRRRFTSSGFDCLVYGCRTQLNIKRSLCCPPCLCERGVSFLLRVSWKHLGVLTDSTLKKRAETKEGDNPASSCGSFPSCKSAEGLISVWKSEQSLPDLADRTRTRRNWSSDSPVSAGSRQWSVFIASVMVMCVYVKFNDRHQKISS